MKINFLNKTRPSRSFGYTPMYYDDRKERLEQKKKLYSDSADGGFSESDRAAHFKANLKENWSRSQARKDHQKGANMRTMILIALILILGYFIFSGVDTVDTVVTKIW